MVILRRAIYLPALLAAAACLPDPAAAQEDPKNVIAAHIRMQGFTCDKPQSAERMPRESRPNETVWVLKCENRSYQVRLVPDMAAAVLPLD
jgi:hypothetical protein